MKPAAMRVFSLLVFFMQILLIKMSSMGDLVHNCPLVSDLARHFPEAAIDWVAEEAYAPIPALHPAVRRVLPIAWRRWRKSLWRVETWQEFFLFQQKLKEHTYDLVLDTQGLLKSAWVAKLSTNTGIVGGTYASIKEGPASFFYDKKLAIAKSRHVIERCRAVGAGAVGYDLETPPFYGIRAHPLSADWLPAAPYAVLMQAASRPEKLWAEENWVALGTRLHALGIYSVLPWGNAAEKARAQALADKITGAIIPPLMDLKTVASFLAGSELVIGLDTGFTHFAAALGRPTIGVFCDSDSEQAAVLGDAFCESFGKKGHPPPLSQVAASLEKILAQKGRS